jgi:eukaryotic-like serine/threonine-protein kinase
LIGRTINNFQITALLGEGGMGAVYEARHPVIDRRVAIKVLKRELARDRELVARFVNEAKAASSIRHPGIIEVLDVGELDDGIPYLTMQLLEGESLRRRLSRIRRFGVEHALAIVAQAASALTAAHRQGIVHRDLKPDNLYLVPDAAAPYRDLVKVLDFGIAKLRPEFAGPLVRTQTGSILGTPAYMSPEQCRGMTEIDHRSDVYSLGIILYEMLCGELPFFSERQGDLLIRQATEPPRPPRALNSLIPPAVNRAILRALEKPPGARFDSMIAFCAALGVTIGSLDVPAGPPSTVVRPEDEAAKLPTLPQAPITTLSSMASVFGGSRKSDKSRAGRGRRALVLAAVTAGAAAAAALVFGFGVGKGPGTGTTAGPKPVALSPERAPSSPAPVAVTPPPPAAPGAAGPPPAAPPSSSPPPASGPTTSSSSPASTPVPQITSASETTAPKSTKKAASAKSKKPKSSAENATAAPAGEAPESQSTKPSGAPVPETKPRKALVF